MTINFMKDEKIKLEAHILGVVLDSEARTGTKVRKLKVLRTHWMVSNEDALQRIEVKVKL